MSIIGKRLKKLRTHHKLSLRKLAKITGLSHSFLSDIEHGRSNPSIESLEKIARAFEVEIGFFLTKMVDDDDLLIKKEYKAC